MLRGSTGTYTISKAASPSSPVTMTFTGGQIDAGSNSAGTILGNFTIGNGVTLAGDFTLVRGNLNLGGTVGNFAAHSGSIAVDGGVLNVDSANRLSSSSNLTVQAGSVFLKNSTPMGDVQINGGVVNVGSTADTVINFELKSLSGIAGTLRANINPSASSTPAHQVTINQAIDTTFSGTVNGFAQSSGGSGGAYLQLKKSGTGTLTLSGEIQDLRKTTTVDGGRLYINGNSTSFGDVDGSRAISVASGGALGGTGTITTLAGDNIVVAAGGKLIAGTFGQADRTTYALGAGANLNLSAASAQTEWLRFDLGTDDVAGTSYSQIALTSGTLVIGNALEFDDFDFNALSGFGAGTYTLFDVTGASIFGNLGSSNAGLINGFDATLSFDSKGIYLTVIPEPKLALLGAIGGSILLLRARRRK